LAHKDAGRFVEADGATMLKLTIILTLMRGAA
jgi:hypothetical protein